MTHHGVSLAAVVGVPHESARRGDQGVRHQGAGCDRHRGRAGGVVQGEMAAYKYPRVVEFRDQLPMTATGKILKRELS